MQDKVHPSSANKARTLEEPIESGRRERLDAHRLEALTGFRLRMANLAVYRDFAAATAPLQLTQKQYAVLELAACNPGASQTELAERLGMDKATMMALIDRLQGKELIERRSFSQDRRRQEIHLTSQGAHYLNQARELIAEHEARMFAGWSVEELAAFRDALLKIAQG